MMHGRKNIKYSKMFARICLKWFLSQFPEFSDETKHLSKTIWDNCMNLVGDYVEK
jgi:hypothetical protein